MTTTKRPEGVSPSAVETASGLWRVDLQRHDLSIAGRQVVQTRIEITPDSRPFKHFHYGEEVICVLQGSLEHQIEGHPIMVCVAGDALTVPYRLPHTVRNIGDGLAIELATYVVEKGRPILTKVE
ncbi:cupin domain-containing protein [Micromonospora endolithica]|uniref:Cupin domain-containing protein n=1 Tax=Micromonospora endolithica TaxID=230091 RepID=A0A3A9YNX7_9ACTN|nr:cupin domain-containing protein [Micromonospora endolithica]RKN37682.1 cupin domain-containing protein [Micromonospora endolithica]TWJ25176.1 Cupin domain-containing protein [Micromonospora endolithica]